MKVLFVSILGKPNAGKSSLLNALIGEKISIISEKAQTTRNNIIGVFNDFESQIVFCDTPGIHNAKNKLGTFMNKEAFIQMEGVDLVYYLFDATKKYGEEDEKIIERIFNSTKDVFLLITKIDLINKKRLLDTINFFADKFPFKEIIPISSIKNDNLDTLIKVSKKYAIESQPFYETNTNLTLNFRIGEIVREKILNNFYQEVPHQIACLVEDVKVTEKRFFVYVLIIVAKKTHKAMIIGKGGQSLKKINYEASKDIKNLVNKKVFLNLHVKVDEQWFNDENKLARYGFDLKMQNE